MGQHQEKKVSGDIISIIRENRYLKEQLEHKDWECKELRSQVKWLKEEVRKLRTYVSKESAVPNQVGNGDDLRSPNT